MMDIVNTHARHLHGTRTVKIYWPNNFFFVVQQSKSGLRRITAEVSGLDTIRHTHPIGLL